MRGLKGNKALITGASGGIGSATAVRLAEEGMDLTLVDLSADALAPVVAECEGHGVQVEARAVDVRDEDQVEACVAGHLETFGRIDTLANIAGVQKWHHSHEHPVDDFRLTLDVNVLGTFLFCRAALPSLFETKGSIINAASINALRGITYSVAYAASKGAVLQLTRSLAVEYASKGVRVNAVAPGGIDTPMTTEITFPEGVNWDLLMKGMSQFGMQPPSVIAGTVAFLASDDASHISGDTIVVDGATIA